MIAFRLILGLVGIFLFVNVNAFEDIVEGNLYKFKYHVEERSFVHRGIKNTRNHRHFGGILKFKALSENVLECKMLVNEGQGFDYMEEFHTKFTVKIDGDKVLSVNSTGTFTEEGNLKKKEIIEQIIKDRSDIIKMIKDGNYQDKTAQIEMPIGGKCEARVGEETHREVKYYKARSTAPNCVVKENILSQLKSMGFGNPSEDSPTEVTLIYNTATDKQVGLRLYVAIRMWSANGDIVLSNQKIEIQFLGSEAIENETK